MSCDSEALRDLIIAEAQSGQNCAECINHAIVSALANFIVAMKGQHGTAFAAKLATEMSDAHKEVLEHIEGADQPRERVEAVH